MSKLKDFLDLYKDVCLLDVPEKPNLLNNVSGDFTEYNEREIEEINSFYQRTGLFKYGVIVTLKPVKKEGE